MHEIFITGKVGINSNSNSGNAQNTFQVNVSGGDGDDGITILRMATFEILHSDTPKKVVVNEAVELSKTFGSETSARFTNGVLGSVVSDLGQEIATTV